LIFVSLEFILSGAEVSRKMKATEHVSINYHLSYFFHFPFEASKGNKNASIFKVPAYALASLKKISPCRCICFATWLNPIHLAKLIRLHKPLLEIFLHSTAKIACSFRFHLKSE
jgi:hypothetical protein